ncbi:protein kinase family protein [Dyadobacter sp. CY261]|uniref:protein kinase family protein n=1 Tax=Dyadobacter sp. CY261 TaxID=2907203 RepID=UPI001F1A129A|nr:protein kinase family protein [Dyadobacter sp. CY261]MCF0075597.1 protein kinase family protein [Dyadobacter sp. CY261]
MKFNFPDNATFLNGVLKNFGQKYPVDIDTLKPQENLIEIDKLSYFYTYLGASSGNKGGNSIVLRLFESQSIDTDDPDYSEPDKILKISKYPIQKFGSNRPEKRFKKEIESLFNCKRNSFQNVIDIFQFGICRVRNVKDRSRFDDHLFYTMEFAQNDLKSYIEQNHVNMGTEEKLGLCLSLSEGLKELNSLGYYHRDIKPDNIFMIGDRWKIGDLGLINERNTTDQLDSMADFIGPKGWISPEAMNKYLCEGKGYDFRHNFEIDHQSDIFQLGKVFWYIFQHNAPIGSISESDFLIKNSSIYSLIRTMLNYSKTKRFKHINEVITLLKKCEEKNLRQLVA